MDTSILCQCLTGDDIVLPKPQSSSQQQAQPYPGMPYPEPFDAHRLLHHATGQSEPYYSPYASDTQAGVRSGKRKREAHEDQPATSDAPTDGLQAPHHSDWNPSYSSPASGPVYSSESFSGPKGQYANPPDSYSYAMEPETAGWSSALSPYGPPFSQSTGGQIITHHPHHDEPAPPPYLHPDSGLYEGSGLPPMSSFRSSQFASPEPHHSSSMSKALYSAPSDHAAGGYPPPASTPVSSPSNWTSRPTTSGSFSATASATEPVVSVHQNLHPIVSFSSPCPACPARPAVCDPRCCTFCFCFRRLMILFPMPFLMTTTATATRTPSHPTTDCMRTAAGGSGRRQTGGGHPYSARSRRGMTLSAAPLAPAPLTAPDLTVNLVYSTRPALWRNDWTTRSTS